MLGKNSLRISNFTMSNAFTRPSIIRHLPRSTLSHQARRSCDDNRDAGAETREQFKMDRDKQILSRESRAVQNARRKDMRSIDVREAHPDDVDAMREVQHLTWVATYPNEVYGITKEDIEARFRENPETTEERRERRRQFVSTAPFHSWVALEGTDLIGFCTIKQDEHEALIQALYVLPDYQNKGVGKRLLQTVLDW